MKVVDSSALYQIVLGTSLAPAVAAHLDDDLLAPELLITEVLHRLRHLANGKVITARRADQAVEILATADIEYLRCWPYTDRIGDLRHNVTTADATYVALAEELGCPLLTCDARLGRAPGLRVPVIVV